MTQQLALFSSPANPAPIIDPVAGFEPTFIGPRHPSYRPFDGAEVKRIVLLLCEASGADWVDSHKLYDKTRMHPSDVGKMLHRMVSTGLLERTQLYYGSSSPMLGNYKGFKWGYRLPQEATR
jgi:hypothetical protein